MSATFILAVPHGLQSRVLISQKTLCAQRRPQHQLVLEDPKLSSFAKSSQVFFLGWRNQRNTFFRSESGTKHQHVSKQIERVIRILCQKEAEDDSITSRDAPYLSAGDGSGRPETSLVQEVSTRTKPPSIEYMNVGRIEADSPFYTYVFLFANIFIYGLEVLFETQRQNGTNLILAFGSKINELIVAGEYWRLVTPIFLHGGLLHLALNSVALLQLAPQVEMGYGPRAFIALYLISGMFGNLLSFLFTPGLSIGASGSVFGLVGAWATYIALNRPVFGSRGDELLRNMAIITAVNLAIGLQPPLDNWSHIGGLLGGAGFALIVCPKLIAEQVPLPQLGSLPLPTPTTPTDASGESSPAPSPSPSPVALAEPLPSLEASDAVATAATADSQEPVETETVFRPQYKSPLYLASAVAGAVFLILMLTSAGISNQVPAPLTGPLL